MKPALLACAALIAASLPAGAQTADAPLSVTAAPTYVSVYMYRGRQLAGASFQPSIEADAGRAAFGIWSSTPFQPSSLQRFTEVDPYASYGFALNSQFTLTPGFEAYFYPSTSDAVGYFHARYEPNLSLSYAAHGVRLSPSVYYDLTLRQLTVELTGVAALPLSALGTEVDLTGTAGNYTAENALNAGGLSEKAWGSYWLLGAAVPYQLAPHLKTSLGYAYTEGFGAHTQLGTLPSLSNPQAVGRSVVTFSIALTF